MIHKPKALSENQNLRMMNDDIQSNTTSVPN
jgi:hypothetical protein